MVSYARGGDGWAARTWIHSATSEVMAKSGAGGWAVHAELGISEMGAASTLTTYVSPMMCAWEHCAHCRGLPSFAAPPRASARRPIRA